MAQTETEERDIRLSSLIKEIRLIMHTVNEDIWQHVKILADSVKMKTSTYAHGIEEPVAEAKPEPPNTFQTAFDEVALLKDATKTVNGTLGKINRRILPEPYSKTIG